MDVEEKYMNIFIHVETKTSKIVLLITINFVDHHIFNNVIFY
jgi:hypothetical protein